MTTPLPSKPVPTGPTASQNPPDRVIERLWSRKHLENGCWISDYSTGSHGYAQLGWSDSSGRYLWLAHRISWFAVNGDIPDGMTVDHTCRNRKCINPDHLRLLTNWDNARRNNQGGSDEYPSDWSCKRGHPSERRSKVTGDCLDCHKIHCEKYKSNKKGLVA